MADGDDANAFLTVAGRGKARFEIAGSKFIGRVAQADTVEAAEAFVAEIESHHPDATHNVPAYRVPASGAERPRERTGREHGTATPPRSSAGPPSGRGEATGASGPMLREWSSDADEPTGSAGKPALNVLIQRDLRNVAAVVTRYYGGTNLGVGGLARAYSRAVSEAVEAAGVVEERPHERFVATVEYDDSGTVRGIFESAGAKFDADYEERVRFEVRVPVAAAEALRDRLRSATSGRIVFD